MILRLLNIQGIAGIAASLALGILLLVRKGETRHWQKQSAGFEQLYHQDQAAFARLSRITAPPRPRLPPPITPTRSASLPTSEPSTKGRNMISKRALPLLAMTLSACATTSRPRPIPVLAEAHQCPAYPLPPEALLKPPAKTDFLPPMR